MNTSTRIDWQDDDRSDDIPTIKLSSKKLVSRTWSQTCALLELHSKKAEVKYANGKSAIWIHSMANNSGFMPVIQVIGRNFITISKFKIDTKGKWIREEGDARDTYFDDPWKSTNFGMTKDGTFVRVELKAKPKAKKVAKRTAGMLG